MRTVLHILCALCVSVCIPAVVSAQQASALIFSEQAFDFGSIREDGGKVEHTFRFRNGGDKPVVIVSATSTCGCTVPSFSQKPVMPDADGEVKVTFDPMNSPGRFDKRVTIVTSEADASPVRLRLSGNVIPRQKSVDEQYPVYIGNGLRAETNFHSFAYVEHGKSARTAIELINTSDKPLTINIANDSATKVYKVESPSFPLTLRPHEKSGLTIAADVAAGSPIYGTVTETLVFEVNGRRSDATVAVTGIVVDNRDEQAGRGIPKAEFSKTVVALGKMKHGGEVRRESFEILNSGDAPLTIRAVEGAGEGTSFSLRAGDTIAAGQRRRVEVVVQPSQKDYGAIVERVRWITDDPARPMRDMKITMIIEG